MILSDVTYVQENLKNVEVVFTEEQKNIVVALSLVKQNPTLSYIASTANNSYDYEGFNSSNDRLFYGKSSETVNVATVNVAIGLLV